MRRTRSAAIIVLKCAIIGLGASAQQAAFGAEMALPPMPAIKAIKELNGSSVILQPPGAQSLESGQAPLPPLVVAQTGGDYIPEAKESKNTDVSVESQAIAQETKNANAPTEPQAVMREIKSATRLSSSKQRRRKPKMVGIPAGSQTAAQETKEPESQVVERETRKPKMAGIPTGPQAAAQETKEPESRAVAQEDENAGVLDSSLAATQETKKTAAPPDLGAGLAASPKKKKYGMAPIRWGARITETVGFERLVNTYHTISNNGSSSNSSLVNTQTADVNARTYILQPYIAQVGGNIGVISKRSGASDSSRNISSSGRNNQLFGRGSLALFPQSRFPFRMSLGVSSRHDISGIQANDGVRKDVSLTQSYKPLGKNAQYRMGYTRYTDTATSVNSNYSAWDGSYSMRDDEHQLVAETRLKEKTFSIDKTVSLNSIKETRSNNVTVKDTYLPSDSMWSFKAFGNLNTFTERDGSGIRYMLANTRATWQPEDEDIPLFVEGQVHLYDELRTTRGLTNRRSQSLGASTKASYLFSNILTGNASGNVTVSSRDGTRELTTQQQGTLLYRPNTIRLWKNSAYSWNANSGIYNITNSAGGDSRVFGGAGQNLSIPYTPNIFGRKLYMGSSINQSLAASASRVGGLSITLSNGATMTWSSALASLPKKEFLGGYGRLYGGADTSASLAVNDIRVYGKNPSRNRSVTLGFNLNSRELGTVAYARSGLAVNMGVESKQGTGGMQTKAQLVGVGSLTYSYKKSRVFNVRGLSYAANAGISRQTSANSSTGFDPQASNPSFPWKIDQGLTYKIGQNELKLNAALSDSSGVKNASLWLLFKAWRTAGN